MNIIDQCIEKSRSLNRHIVLPEGAEPRTVVAASRIAADGIARVTLLGEQSAILDVARNEKVSLDGVTLSGTVTSEKFDAYSHSLCEIRKSKGLSRDDARKLLADTVYFGTMMVQMGDADGLVSGAIHSTADTIRPALQIIKTKPGISLVSGVFIMLVPHCELGEHGVFLFADCAVNPDPNAAQLAEIALCTAETAQTLLGVEPRVAMLSFSTKGSATHAYADKVIEATRIAREKAPHLIIDGELQADAALIASVGLKKAPESMVAGRANVLIFPDLQSGNISYKLVERLAHAQAVGPFLQGLAKPVNDLSRGCSVQDIVEVVAVTSVQSSIR